MFRRIVAPTDLSERANEAVRLAARWASKLDADLVVLHVDEDFESGMHGGAEIAEFLGRIEQTRQDALDGIQFDAEAQGARVSIERRRGEPAEEIRDAVTHASTDLLVLSADASTGFRRLMGGTTKRLARKLPCAALILTPESLERGLHHSKVRRVLYPTDFSDASIAGLRVAVEFARANEARLEVLHVLQLPTFFPGTPGDPAIAVPHEFSTQREQLFRNKLDELCASFSGVEISYRVTIAQAVAPAIAEFARRYDFDVVCVPAQGHGAIHNVLFGSVAESTLELSDRPVLILPPIPVGK